MSKSKNAAVEPQAEAELRPEIEVIEPIAVEGPKAPEPVVEEPKVPAAPVKQLTEWAAAKGHVPPKKIPKFRGDFHRGPHVDVVLMRARLVHKLAPNSLITEEAYDAIVEEAYSLPIGET